MTTTRRLAAILAADVAGYLSEYLLHDIGRVVRLQFRLACPVVHEGAVEGREPPPCLRVLRLDAIDQDG